MGGNGGTAHRNAATAYTYAWWLTGDDAAAAAAVRTGIRHPEVRATPADQQLARLLREVRRVAIPARTMCPASELALLHDGHGLSLDVAAAVSEVPAADARTELAHGRLEALLETVDEEFVHPERLGGLAVGNPPDVAHARQCTSCERVRTLLARGRSELCALPAVPAPAGLLAELRGDGGADDATEEAAPQQRTGVLVGVAVVCLAALVGAGYVLLRDDVTGASVPTPAARPGETFAPAPSPENTAPGLATPAGAATGPPDGFRISEAGIVPAGSVEPVDGAVIAHDEPVRLAVTYSGAAASVELIAHWTVDGSPFRSMQVLLSSRSSTHVFGADVPPGGWPTGAHEVALTVDGVVIEVVQFTVA